MRWRRGTETCAGTPPPCSCLRVAAFSGERGSDRHQGKVEYSVMVHRRARPASCTGPPARLVAVQAQPVLRENGIARRDSGEGATGHLSRGAISCGSQWRWLRRAAWSDERPGNGWPLRLGPLRRRSSSPNGRHQPNAFLAGGLLCRRSSRPFGHAIGCVPAPASRPAMDSVMVSSRCWRSGVCECLGR